MINPLFVILSPRNILIVKEQIEKFIEPYYDTIWVKEFRAPRSQNIGLKYLLTDENTHLVMVPDDVYIPHREYIEKLLKHAQDYDVISGVCNFGCMGEREKTISNVCIDGIPDPLSDNFYTSDLWTPMEYFKSKAPEDKPIKVKFSGFPISCIKTWVLKNYEFKGDSRGQNLDIEFSKYLLDKGIDQYVVPGAWFLHLRGHPDIRTNEFRFKNPRVIEKRKGKSRKIHIYEKI